MRTGGSSPASRAAWHSAMHIVGTPSRTVVRVCVIVASVCSARTARRSRPPPPASSVETTPVDRLARGERRRAEHDVLRAERERIRGIAGGGEDAGMGEDRALRASRRPGREEHDRGSAGSRSTSSLSPAPSVGRSSSTKATGVAAATRSSTSGAARRILRGTTIAPMRRVRSMRRRRRASSGSSIATRSPAVLHPARAAAMRRRPPGVELRVRDRVPLEPQRRAVAVRGRTVYRMRATFIGEDDPQAS